MFSDHKGIQLDFNNSIFEKLTKYLEIKEHISK